MSTYQKHSSGVRFPYPVKRWTWTGEVDIGRDIERVLLRKGVLTEQDLIEILARQGKVIKTKK